MNMIEIISEKRDKKALNKEEIEYFIERLHKRRNSRLSSVSPNDGNMPKSE